jgi:ABC-type nitrate/sulfonate/bicarbonate transport system permease component
VTRWRRPAVYAGVILVTLLAWWLLTVSGAVGPLLLASIPDVLTSLGSLMQHPSDIVEPIAVTVAETAIAFAIALVVGVSLGLVVGSSALLRRAYEPLATGLSAVPLVILYPVLAAALGVGSPSKVVLGALYAFFPVVISTIRAVSRVDGGLISASQAMGAGRGQIMRSVVAPAVVVPVISSLRVAWALALVTIIAAEFIAGSHGVGYQLGAASQLLDTPLLFAWIVLAILLITVVNVLFTALSRLTLKGIER